MRSVICPVQVVQGVESARGMEPTTSRAGVVRGLRALSVACTALNSASAMIAGPMIGICPAFGFSVSLFDQRQLNSRSATYTRV